MPATPVYADAFSIDGGWVSFRRAPSGRIVALSMSLDRVWDLQFARQPASGSSSF